MARVHVDGSLPRMETWLLTIVVLTVIWILGTVAAVLAARALSRREPSPH